MKIITKSTRPPSRQDRIARYRAAKADLLASFSTSEDPPEEAVAVMTPTAAAWWRSVQALLAEPARHLTGLILQEKITRENHHHRQRARQGAGLPRQV